MNWPPIIIAAAVAIFLGGFGGLMTPIGDWYRNLRKPALQPPNWLFGPAWTIILGLAAWSAVVAWEAAPGPAARTTVVILFATNAVFHALWSPLFFRLRRPDWALIEVVFLWASLVALVVGLWPISQQASLLIMPYLLWVSFASWLNSAIVRLNRPFA
ncbi:tryptophan-rich sensory protein [Polymorphobacter arshaanensis]|uniref:Tryptophan-rich sensory protein n=1 Tax=Glacieibacterium arshaanense TaxID=2511025 RepID=A0A4Y9EM95_9SPHN|nr:TspO/MBR family protein [Polymorphobacter arshaanensis]TFU03128.1 tryptophan-rich sensory protein [Polymorphobacter arshaanensis]